MPHRLLLGGLAVALVILTLLAAAILAFDAAADREYRRAGFHQVNGRWVP